METKKETTRLIAIVLIAVLAFIMVTDRASNRSAERKCSFQFVQQDLNK